MGSSRETDGRADLLNGSMLLSRVGEQLEGTLQAGLSDPNSRRGPDLFERDEQVPLRDRDRTSNGAGRQFAIAQILVDELLRAAQEHRTRRVARTDVEAEVILQRLGSKVDRACTRGRGNRILPIVAMIR
ncbi:hypothetical protein COO55_38830 [Rhodococcus opacus]|nr:hypothetical protein COO55_38830 [Rhodococcus opacus]